MRVLLRTLGIIAFSAVFMFSMAGCSEEKDEGSVTATPDKIPLPEHYTFSNFDQLQNNVTSVLISKKEGASPGEVVNIRYNGTDLSQREGVYTVEFDVEAAPGWKAGVGLEAPDFLVVTALKVPSAEHYDITGLRQKPGNVIGVEITAKTDGTVVSPGAVSNIRYGANAAAATGTVPQTEGEYNVYFNVAEAEGWFAGTNLEAGILSVTSSSNMIVNGDFSGLPGGSHPTGFTWDCQGAVKFEMENRHLIAWSDFNGASKYTWYINQLINGVDISKKYIFKAWLSVGQNVTDIGKFEMIVYSHPAGEIIASRDVGPNMRALGNNSNRSTTAYEYELSNIAVTTTSVKVEIRVTDSTDVTGVQKLEFSPDEREEFALNYNITGSGDFTGRPDKMLEGSAVTLTPAPTAGNRLISVTTTPATNVTVTTSGNITFDMPTAAVTVNAVFAPNPILPMIDDFETFNSIMPAVVTTVPTTPGYFVFRNGTATLSGAFANGSGTNTSRIMTMTFRHTGTTVRNVRIGMNFASVNAEAYDKIKFKAMISTAPSSFTVFAKTNGGADINLGTFTPATSWGEHEIPLTNVVDKSAITHISFFAATTTTQRVFSVDDIEFVPAAAGTP